MLDWSYETITPIEQSALCRLAVFDSCFDDVCAQRVLVGDDIDRLDVWDILTNLAAKSVLFSDAAGTGIRFRLPETTRAYALEKLRDLDGAAAPNRSMR